MSLQNRVTPEGEIIATPHRGDMLGNRGGAFHGPGQRLGVRRWATSQWICCVLAFKGRRRALMQPKRYTELFFLDEATALAAGHRPCFECRRADATRFARLWQTVRGLDGRAAAPDMDCVLHRERITSSSGKLTYSAPLNGLPAGTFVRFGGRICLVCEIDLLPWTPAGYEPPIPRSSPRTNEPVDVLTPPSIVDVIGRGYQPMLHASARKFL